MTFSPRDTNQQLRIVHTDSVNDVTVSIDLCWKGNKLNMQSSKTISEDVNKLIAQLVALTQQSAAPQEHGSSFDDSGVSASHRMSD